MLTSMLDRIWTDIRRARRRRRAIADLSALDDRMLKDIGISRCEIVSVVGCTRQGPEHAVSRSGRPSPAGYAAAGSSR